MIYFYSGTPGSGKSLHVAKDIKNFLTHKINVIANFDINLTAIKKLNADFVYIDNFELTPKFLTTYAKEKHVLNKKGQIKEGQTYVIIDECQLIFNCRDWGNKSRSSWISFFTQHRKLGFHIILISQSDGMIDRQIRSLFEYEYKHRKVNNFGFGGSLTSLFLFGKPFFAVIEYWYGSNLKCGTTFFLGNKNLYALYDSYNLFSGANA